MVAGDLAVLLAKLADASRPAPTIVLTELSDLTRGEMSEFRQVWAGLAGERRLALAAAMVEQAEANIHLNFHAVLRECLQDVDPGVRRLAIDGLWEDERLNLMPALIALLEGDPDSGVRASAATSLGRYVLLGVLGEIAEEPFRQVEDALRAAWARQAEPVEVRCRVLESLAYISSASLHDLIQVAYYDDDGLMRQSALFAMGRSVDRRWSKIVLAELGGLEPAMRFEAAVASGEMALRQAVPRLVGLLDDADSSVREAAAEALGKIGGNAARRALEALAAGSDPALAQAAEDALDELRFNADRPDEVLSGHEEEVPVGDDIDDELGDDELDDDELDDDDGLWPPYASEALQDEDDVGWDDEDDDPERRW